MVIYLAVTAGVAEEAVFRGLAWTIVSRLELGGLRGTAYVLGSSVLFAAVHWEQGVPGLVSAFAFGVLAAYLYLRLANLWPMIAAHVLTDMEVFG